MPSPLAGVRILVTRPRGQASALATQLEALGATTILIPTIELAPPNSFYALDAALASLQVFDWLLFTSANAVQIFVDRARHLRLDPQAKRIAAIGPATAAAVEAAGLRPAHFEILVPTRHIAEGLAEALLPHAPGAAMLLVRAAVARDLLPEALTAAGANVTIATAYQTIIPPDSVKDLRLLFADPEQHPHAITFTSASSAANFAALLEAAGCRLPGGMVLASIGPVTSQAIRELGLDATFEASDATIPSLVQALAIHFKADPPK